MAKRRKTHKVDTRIDDDLYDQLLEFDLLEGFKENRSAAVRELIKRGLHLSLSKETVQTQISQIEHEIGIMDQAQDLARAGKTRRLAELKLLLGDRDQITQDLLMEKDLTRLEKAGKYSYLIHTLRSRAPAKFLVWLEKKEEKICRALGIEEGYALRRELELMRTAIINNHLAVSYLDSTQEKALLHPKKTNWRELAQEAVENDEQSQHLQLQIATTRG